MTYEICCLLIGVMGLVGATFAFPLLAACLNSRSVHTRFLSDEGSQHLLVSLPVAPHSARALYATLSSLDQALSQLPQDIQVTVQAVLDGEDIGNQSVVEQFSWCRLHGHKQPQGKWKTIRTLQEVAFQYDWVVSVDVGTLLPEKFFQTLKPYLAASKCAALFPGYELERSGLSAKLFWDLERGLKQLENIAGGPVSAHGACMIFRGEALGYVLGQLSGSSYYNDDVVLPLAIRTYFPTLYTQYLPGLRVRDGEASFEQRPQRKRRKRLAVGNAQWIRSIFPLAVQTNPIVALLACRRIFRLLWGYWALAVVVGLATMGVSSLAAALIAGVVVLVLLTRAQDAFLSSVESPRWLLNPYPVLEWK